MAVLVLSVLTLGVSCSGGGESSSEWCDTVEATAGDVARPGVSTFEPVGERMASTSSTVDGVNRRLAVVPDEIADDYTAAVAGDVAALARVDQWTIKECGFGT